MGTPNRQIGWSTEANLLQSILKQVNQLTSVVATSGGGGATDHNTLSNLQLAAPGVTYGHISDAAQTIAGVKTMINTGATQIHGLSLTNNGTGSSQILNITNSSSGVGQRMSNNSSGIAIKIDNTSTGSSLTLNSSTGSTGDLLQFAKNNVSTTSINHLGVITSSPSVSASALLARGMYVNPTLTATANNDVLVGLDINPSFNAGAFSGVKTIGIRTNNITSGGYFGVTNIQLSSGALAQPINFYLQNTVVEVGRFFGTTGNFTLQNGGTFTDAGYRLDVQGTTRLNGIVTLGAQLRLKNYTVATLPAGTQGDKAYVTDASAPTFGSAVVGGGAVVIPVFYNGTTWIVG